MIPSTSRQAVIRRIERAKAAAQAAREAAAAAAAGGKEAEGSSEGLASTPAPPALFNRVVRIDGEESYSYWYVLTYLPDLQWCHVVPLTTSGTFQHGTSRGRPRWMLVDEDKGGEMDVSAARCEVMRALEMKSTKEIADEEEWDILGPEINEPAGNPRQAPSDSDGLVADAEKSPEER